jgi:hypothetical protein
MAFTVEDGTQVANSNAYISVAEFRAFHVDRGVAAAANDTGVYAQVAVEAAIVKATDYVDKRFGTRFVGSKLSRDQSLQWPRIDAFDNQEDYIQTDEIPKVLKNAVCEYAKLALTLVDLLPVPAPNFNKVDPATGETTVSQGGILQRKREKVGPIEEDTWYSQEQWRLEAIRAAGVHSEMVSTINLPEYPVADEWLKPIVKTGGSIRLSRG